MYFFNGKIVILVVPTLLVGKRFSVVLYDDKFQWNIDIIITITIIIT